MKTFFKLQHAVHAKLGMCAIIASLSLASCSKKELDDINIESTVSANDVTVQNSRLVFSSYGAWQNTVNKIIGFDRAQLASWQKEFTGFAPLSSSEISSALKSKPDGLQPVDKYFLAMLNKDGIYQIGNEVFIFVDNTLYTLVNPTEAEIQKTKEDAVAGKAVASANLKVALLRDSAPRTLKGINDAGSQSSSAGTANYVDETYDQVQYQWYQGNNIYYKYQTRFGVQSAYQYNNHPTLRVYIFNGLLYSKSNVSWWDNAGENANKTFSTISIAWSGVGQQNLAGGWGPVSNQLITLQGASRSDNQLLVIETLISAERVDGLTLTGTVYNSVNWNTNQSSTKNLSYTVYNLIP